MRTKLFASLLVTLVAWYAWGVAQEPEKFTPEPGKVYDVGTLAQHVYDDFRALGRIQNGAARDLANKDFRARYDGKEISVKGPVWKVERKSRGGYPVYIGQEATPDSKRSPRMRLMVRAFIDDREAVAKLKPNDMIVVKGFISFESTLPLRLIRATLVSGE